jgi:hypothetical protein
MSALGLNRTYPLKADIAPRICEYTLVNIEKGRLGRPLE